MMSKKLLIRSLLGSAALVAVLSAAALSTFDNSPSLNRASPYMYTVSLTSVNKPTIPGVGFGSGTSTSHFVNFSYLLADEDVGAQNANLSAAGGSIVNTSPITGFYGIEVVFSGGDLRLYTGNTQSPSTNSEVLTSASYKFITDARYFRLLANGPADTLIESVVIDYTCQALPSDGLQYYDLGTSYSVTGYTGTDTTVVIPSLYNGKPVSKIDHDTFNGKSTITSIAIPDSVTSIEYNAFAFCTSLTSITIPDSVISISSNLFYGCTGLVSATLSNAITTISPGAFFECNLLTSITIPGGVTYVQGAAFYNCSSLNAISFQGTIAQWSAVSRGANWNTGVPATSVVCTDGSAAI